MLCVFRWCLVGHFVHLHLCLHAVLTCRLLALSLVSLVTELWCSLTDLPKHRVGSSRSGPEKVSHFQRLSNMSACGHRGGGLCERHFMVYMTQFV